MVLKTGLVGLAGSTRNWTQSDPIKISKISQNWVKLETRGQNSFAPNPVFTTMVLIVTLLEHGKLEIWTIWLTKGAMTSQSSLAYTTIRDILAY